MTAVCLEKRRSRAEPGSGKAMGAGVPVSPYLPPLYPARRPRGDKRLRPVVKMAPVVDSCKAAGLVGRLRM